MNNKFPFFFILILIPAILLSCTADDFGSESDIEISEGARSLYAFGDSWVDQMDDEVIQQELADRGFDELVQVRPFGAGGSTVTEWADDEEGILSDMLEVIENDPNPNPILFFTLSGNDFLEGGAAEKVQSDMRSLLAQLQGTRDDLHIVYAGYDIMNPSVALEECNELFQESLGTTDPFEMNNLWVDLYAGVEQVTAEFDAVTVVNTYGALQGRPGDPDLNEWSPDSYLIDCIHLTDEGYGLYLDTVFDEALTPLIENGS